MRGYFGGYQLDRTPNKKIHPNYDNFDGLCRKWECPESTRHDARMHVR